jgi:hypothetical protein
MVLHHHGSREVILLGAIFLTAERKSLIGEGTMADEEKQIIP